MKKLNKLFAILFAVLGVTTLKAQTDVTSTYLTNAGFDDETSFVNNGVCTYAKDCSANGTTLSQMQPVNGWTFGVTNGDARASGAYAWGATHFLGGQGYTIPSTDEEGNIAGGALGICAVWDAVLYYYQEVTLKPGVYEFSYRVYNSGSGATAVNKNLFGFVADNGTSYYGATKTFTSNSWKTESVSFTLTTETKGKISVGIDAANAGSGNSHHLFVDYIKLTHKSFDDVSAENPADFTSLIVNPSFENGNLDGWTYKGSSDTGVKPNSNGTYTTSGVDGNYLFNTWWQGTPLTQTVGNIPNGIYELKVLLASDQNAKLFLLANDEHSEVYTITTDNKTFHDVSYEFKVLNGQAKIGVVGGNDAGEYVAAGYWWYKADNFRLIYKGADISIEKEALDAALAKARAIDQATIPTVVAVSLNSAISTAENVENALNPIKAATNELLAVLTTVDEVQAPYIETKALLTICNDILDNSVEFEDGAKETFSGIVSTASENVAIAQTSAAINDIYNTLEAARQTYVVKADPINDTYFDYTFLMTNPEVSTESHWTNGRYNTGQQYTGAPDNRYLDSWNGASQDIYQAVEELPNGYYTVKAAGRASTACTSAYIYLNDTKVEIDKAGSTDNDLGNGWKWYTTEKTIVGGVGTATIGFACNSTEGQWAGADDFHFYYYGYDVESAQNTVTYLKNGIEGRRSSIMSSAVREQMETAYNNADASKTTRKELEPMIDALRTAIDAVDVSIAEYEKILGYINMTKVFTDVNTYETKYNNGEYTTDDVEPVRQELNILRFNAASALFTNKVDVTGWTGTMGEMSNEHWSGTTVSYKDANSWNDVDPDALTTQITLPKGNYVLKVAGRCSPENATLTLKVLDQTITFHGKGATGKGIDTSGAANFSDGTYANNNNGFGWEWEFLRFSLDAEQTVTLEVNSSYNNTRYVWNSFGDITLWMDDATYVTVYGKELDAPLAEAKTLVNTLPMGETENTALINAIAQGEETIETPDQLNAAIDALKEAVANAKEWVVAYDEAKAPLVAALERFEADYNDGANGALRPMSDEAWNTLLTAAGTAAKAKDVTDSYANFATEAETFNTAMDNAEPSIILYKKWAGLITSVQAYYDNIKQDDEQLRTAISTASAESSKETDASLTSATEALNAAYQEALDGDFDASIFLGDNLDFESGTGTALDKLIFEIPGWDVEYDGNANENARIQPEYYEEKEANTYAIRIRSNWEDAPTTMRVYKEVVLPSGSYNLSMTLLTSITGSGVNLTYYELNGERTMLSSDTYKKVTAPSIELEEPTILLLSIGLTGTTGNNAQELYADSIALACNAKTLYQRTLENIKALAEDGEPTLVATNVYNEYKDKEDSLTAEQKATAIAVMNNAISIDAADDMVTSLIKNADFTGGTDSYSVQGSGGQVKAPKEWTFGFTFEGWNDTFVADGYFNLWAGGIKYGELSQTIKNLPNGTYRLTADMVTSTTDGSSIAAIYGAPLDGDVARAKNADNDVDFVNYEVYFRVVANQATIGVRTDNNYFKVKNIRLEYVEEDKEELDNGILYQGAYMNRGNNEWDITEFATNASNASVYMINPNALIIANEGQVSNANNVVVDGTAASLVLNDGGYAFNTTADFTATALNYAREFTKDTWLTVCLPFAYPIPENVKVETLGAIDLGTKTFTFDEVTGTMEANTPYLIKNSTETAALFASLSGVEVEATPAAMNVPITADNSEHQGEFIGTYTTVKTDALMEDGTYDILFFGTDGQLYYLSQGITTKVVNIKPFRAYIRLPKGAINWIDGQQARVRHRNSAMTDIEGPELDAQGSMLIYDLMGRRVTAIEKGGIYIVNGKKVIVR